MQKSWKERKVLSEGSILFYWQSDTVSREKTTRELQTEREKMTRELQTEREKMTRELQTEREKMTRELQTERVIQWELREKKTRERQTERVIQWELREKKTRELQTERGKTTLHWSGLLPSHLNVNNRWMTSTDLQKKW